MSKPDCYKCEFRQNIPNDTHSKCTHVITRYSSMNTAYHALQITADQHGIDNHWFVWPFNYDPVWLKTCNGFEPLISE